MGSKAPTSPHAEADLRLLHRVACLAIRCAVEQPDLLTALASSTDEELLRRVVNLPRTAVPANLLQPAGAFVTIQRHIPGAAGPPVLRGCIGSITTTTPLYGVVLRSAVKAAVCDARFTPLAAGELAEVTVTVSVLTVPTPIGHWQEYEVGKHGVILTKGEHRAVFLPEVPIEHGFDREQTLSRLAMKAGLGANAWRHGCSYDVFSTQVIQSELRTAEEVPVSV